MKATLNNLPKSQAELIIEVELAEMQPFLAKAAIRISEAMKMPGFRPGKAPYDLVKQRAGEMAIWEEALDAVVAKTFFQALEENKLETVGRPKIEVQKMAPGNPLVYKAIVALLPKLKLPDYRKIKVKRSEAKVAEEQVKKTLEDLQKMRRQEAAADKAVEKGDKADVDWEMFLAGAPVEDGQAKNANVFVDETFYIPGFVDNLVGLTKGETKEFSLKFPADYFNKNLAGKTIDFKVKINQVFKIELPLLDDAFAKGLGKFETLEALKEQIRKNLAEESRVREEQKAELKMLEEIAAKTKFDEIPNLLIESEAHKMVHELEDNILNQGLKFEDYLQHIKKTEEDLENELKPQAEKRVKTELVVREIAAAEKISVSEEELEKEINKITEMYKDYKEIQEKIKSPDYKEYLKNVLANRKTIELLKTLIIA